MAKKKAAAKAAKRAAAAKVKLHIKLIQLMLPDITMSLRRRTMSWLR